MRDGNLKSGFLCPVCGVTTEVLETRQVSDQLRRRRLCFNDHVFYTVEKAQGEPKQFIPRRRYEV